MAVVWAALRAACTAERAEPILELPPSRLIVDPETARVEVTPQ